MQNHLFQRLPLTVCTLRNIKLTLGYLSDSSTLIIVVGENTTLELDHDCIFLLDNPLTRQ